MAQPSRHVPALMDDLVEEILLRFSPDDPASLVRAALVSKTWCRLVSGAGFRRRFRELHRTPPLLGFLCRSGNAGPFCNRAEGDARFMPAATSFRRLPHAVPPRWHAIAALHDRLLCYDMAMIKYETTDLNLFVYCPFTGEVRRLPRLVPPAMHRWGAALLGTAPGCDYDHVGFRVVVVSTKPSTGVTSAYVFSSEQNTWTLQTPIQHHDVCVRQRHSAHIGDALYFKCENNRFCVEYHIIKQQLSVISLPSDGEHWPITLMTAENGGLGLAMVEGYNLVTLSRGTSLDPEVRWGIRRVICLSKLLPAVTDRMHVAAVVDVLGIFLIGTENGLFTIDMKSNQVRKLWEGNVSRHIGDVVHYMSFCTPGGCGDFSCEPRRTAVRGNLVSGSVNKI
ncbi:hypothetical protein EJB05_14035, partial [Eragrostis curvula]